MNVDKLVELIDALIKVRVSQRTATPYSFEADEKHSKALKTEIMKELNESQRQNPWFS